jgi:7-keto-8-aminopelargonate synthetase-like enzyme
MNPSIYDYEDKFPDKVLLTADGVLNKGQMRYFNPRADYILDRYQGLEKWVSRRLKAGVFSHRMQVVGDPGTEATVRDLAGREFTGINLTTVDYMGLSDHPKLKAAAKEALDTKRMHSVNTGPLLGNSLDSGALETWLANHMKHDYGMIFPTGWAASFSGVAAIARQNDYVVLDEFAHQSLKQGANAACDNVSKFKHLDNEAVKVMLSDIREKDPKAGILVVTEGLYSMDGDAPDIAELLQICKAHKAALLVDICHDLGSTGPNGTGTLGMQGVLGDPDLVVVGAFSKAFSTNGGFMTTSKQGVLFAAYSFAGPYTYSTSLSPMQIAIARTGLELSAGPEGEERRAKLAQNIKATRDRAAEHGIFAYGSPSPIVSLHVGAETVARLACAKAFHDGLVTTILEYPVVSRGKARFRLSMSPEHDTETLTKAVDIIADSIKWATKYHAEVIQEAPPKIASKPTEELELAS